MSDQANTSITELKNPAPREQNMPAVTMGFGSLQSFELMQRAAKMLAFSTLVPVAYRANKEVKEYGRVTGYEDNPNALPNCVVALNMAQRMGADPLMVMQNLYIVEGRPSWSSQFIIAAINSCGRYTPLRFQLSDAAEPRPVEYTESKWVKVPGGKDRREEVKKTIDVANRTCIAWAIEKETGERLESPVISLEMAVAEGWLTKNGSKWQTMPEVMLRYRAAAFFGKLYAPELLMGLQTAEEAADIIEMEPSTPTEAKTIDKLKTPAPSAASAPKGDVTDVTDNTSKTDTSENASTSESVTETGTAAGTATNTKSQSVDSVSFAKVEESLRKATDLDVLDVAADLISAVDGDDLQGELLALYGKRKEELKNPPADKKRTPRNVGNVE